MKNKNKQEKEKDQLNHFTEKRKYRIKSED